MTTNLAFSTADIAVLMVLAILFAIGIRVAAGFFRNGKK